MEDGWEESTFGGADRESGERHPSSNNGQSPGAPLALYSLSEPEPKTPLSLPVLPLTACHRKLADRALWEHNQLVPF